MLENTWYSVISPENCSAILWRSWEYKETAANTMKLTGEDMLKQKLIDGIIPEPLGGAHYDPESTFDNVKKVLLKDIKTLSKMPVEKLVAERQDKFIAMGEFKG